MKTLSFLKDVPKWSIGNEISFRICLSLCEKKNKNRSRIDFFSGLSKFWQKCQHVVFRGHTCMLLLNFYQFIQFKYSIFLKSLLVSSCLYISSNTCFANKKNIWNWPLFMCFSCRFLFFHTMWWLVESTYSCKSIYLTDPV